MLAKITSLVKRYQADIILIVGVILISLLSFAIGYIVAKQESGGQIETEYEEPSSQTYSFIS